MNWIKDFDAAGVSEAAVRRAAGKPKDQRTPRDVMILKTRRAVCGGCCDKFADNRGCDCLEEAIRRSRPDMCGVMGQDLECVECGVRVYGADVNKVCRGKNEGPNVSMSMCVVAFKSPDEEYTKMKAAYDACAAAGVNPPAKVSDYFGDEKPSDKGGLIDLRRCGAKNTPHECLSKYNAEMEEGFEIDVTKLPPGVKFVRFSCVW